MAQDYPTRPVPLLARCSHSFGGGAARFRSKRSYAMLAPTGTPVPVIADQRFSRFGSGEGTVRKALASMWPAGPRRPEDFCLVRDRIGANHRRSQISSSGVFDAHAGSVRERPVEFEPKWALRLLDSPFVRCDDRPPFLDLCPLEGAKSFGRLLLTRKNLLSNIGKLSSHARIS